MWPLRCAEEVQGLSPDFLVLLGQVDPVCVRTKDRHKQDQADAPHHRVDDDSIVIFHGLLVLQHLFLHHNSPSAMQQPDSGCKDGKWDPHIDELLDELEEQESCRHDEPCPQHDVQELHQKSMVSNSRSNGPLQPALRDSELLKLTRTSAEVIVSSRRITSFFGS